MPRLTKEEEAERIKKMKAFDLEKASGGLIAGVDEAGRGPLAGPVFAAAVILPDDCIIEGINDSKKLSEKKREALFEVIKKNALAYAVCSVGEKKIDEINILNATLNAMQNAIERLDTKPDYVLIDGNKAPKIEIPNEPIVKGDSKSMCIAAASILAKVSRDKFIAEIAESYPQYGFDKHKGYGTKYHYEAIKKYGICDIHRKTFLKKILGEI